MLRLKAIFRQLIAVVLLCTFCGDLMTDGIIEAEEKTGIFMLDSEFEDDIVESYYHLVPTPLATAILLLVNTTVSNEVSEHRPFQLSNISPHGWEISIYMDDCVYRI